MAVALDLSAPAHRLTVSNDEYRALSEHFSQRHQSRIRSLARVLRDVSAIAREVSPGAELQGRAKSFRSTWYKLRSSRFGVDQILDGLGVRVIVPTTRDCYRLVERIHGTFVILENEYDDYIRHPKPNGYRSLHTTILAPDRHTVELQVRTRWMHELAEWGTAAHWRYKRQRLLGEIRRAINILGDERNKVTAHHHLVGNTPGHLRQLFAQYARRTLHSD